MLSADTPTDLANKADIQIEAAGIHRVQSVANVLGVLTVTYRAGDFTTDGDAGTSTTTFTKQQDGSGVCTCLLYTSPSPRDVEESRMPSSA